MITPWHLREIRRLYESGGIFAYPTEAVFGLGCHPLAPEAVGRILALKNRPVSKGLILIASNWQQLAPYVTPLAKDQMAAIHATWPGPNTWLIPAATGLPTWLKGDHETLAVRVTDHPIAAAMCESCQGPMVSTSANIAGKNPARSSLQVRKQFPVGLDYVVTASVGLAAKPSTIRDGRSGALLRG